MEHLWITSQKIKFSIKDFLSKYDQIRMSKVDYIYGGNL